MKPIFLFATLLSAGFLTGCASMNSACCTAPGAEYVTSYTPNAYYTAVTTCDSCYAPALVTYTSPVTYYTPTITVY